MKKLVIFGMVTLMLAFSVSLALADPQVNPSGTADTAQSSNTTDASASTGSAVTSVGDVANNGATITADTKSVDVQKTETTTVDKSGQTNSSAKDNIAGAQNSGAGSATDTTTTTVGDVASGNTKTIDSNNTKTVTVDKTSTGNGSEAEKNIAGAQAAGGSTATNTNDVSLLSDNTTAFQKNDDTKNGSAAAINGDATVTKDSGNTKTVTVDKSGQTNVEKASVENEAGAQNVGNGNTATSTYSKSTTIDKSGQNNSKVIGSYNTKDSNNKLYAVDDQVLVNNNSGISVTPDETGTTATISGQNLTVNKTYKSVTANSFNGYTGIGNNAQATGNFNNAKAFTAFNLNGGVGNTNPAP